VVGLQDAISRPMLRTSDKLVKKEAVEVFRQIQIYMKDRPSKTTPMQAALDVMSRGWTHKQLRDEIFVQLCRQTTRNHRQSVTRYCTVGAVGILKMQDIKMQVMKWQDVKLQDKKDIILKQITLQCSVYFVCKRM